MKGRGFKIFGLLAILIMAFGIAGAVGAAPVYEGQDTCPDGDGWHKIDSNDLSSYPVEGADGYCFKAGSDNSEGCIGGLFDSIPEGGFQGEYCGLSHWSWHEGEDEYEACDVQLAVEGEWSDWSDWFWNGSQFERTRTRTITYVDSEDRTYVCGSQEESQSEYQDACPYNPQIPADDPECQPPPDTAGGSLSPFCGGGADFTVDHASLYIDDHDAFTEDGSLELNTGEHSFFWEADKGYEFPEGFVVEGTFTVDRCSTPHREPRTGPESTLPIGAGIAFLGSIGLAVAGLRRITKKS